MWRIINGIPRAIRAHFHGPRAATGVCVDEEKVEFDVDNCKCGQTELKDNRRTFNYQRCEFDCGPGVNWQYGNYGNGTGNDDKDWRKHYSCRNDFWSIFNGPHTTFEAVTWGTVVVLGLQLSRPRWRDRYLSDGNEHRRNSFLYQVAFAMPEFSTRLAIKSEAEPKDQSPNSLEKVMKDFKQMCSTYTALGKSIVGLKQIELGNMSDAVVNLLEASRLGNTSSQFNLGLCYEIGAGVEQDLEKAVECYQMAANSNHPEALYNLALLQKDSMRRNTLMEKAAHLGLARAQLYLGVHYSDSERHEDLVKAASHFQQAADQNDSDAQCFLAMCYERGRGVEVNECKAADLYNKAAQSNHDGALYNLAVFHEYGLGGIPEDRVSAIELYQKAAKAGNENAQFCLDEMKAKEAVEEWKEKYGVIEFIKDDSVQDELPTVNITSGSLSPSASSPSITEYVRKHLLQLQFTDDMFDVSFSEDDDDEKSNRSSQRRRSQRARFSLGEDGTDNQDYLSERRNGLLILSSFTQSSNCSSMGMSRNSTMPELGYIPCP